MEIVRCFRMLASYQVMLWDTVERVDRMMEKVVDRLTAPWKAQVQQMMVENPILLWICSMSAVLGFGLGLGVAIGTGMVTIGSPRLVGDFIFAIYWLVILFILHLIQLLLLPSFLLPYLLLPVLPSLAPPGQLLPAAPL